MSDGLKKNFARWAPLALGVVLAGVFIYGFASTRAPAKQGEVIWARTVSESVIDENGGSASSPQAGSAEFATGGNVYIKYAYIAGIIDPNASPEVIKSVQKTDINITKENIALRTKNSRTFETTSSSVKVSEFISGAPQYYKDDSGRWWQADYATTTPEEFSKLPKSSLYARLNDTSRFAFIKKAFATTSTFYPDPNVEVTSVDGRVGRDNAAGANETFTQLREGAGNVAQPGANPITIRLEADTDTSDSWQALFRFVAGFDTSALPDTDTIDSATLSFVANSKTDNFSQSLVIDRNPPATATDLVNADYNLAGWDGVEQASNRITITAFNTDDATYNDFTLNTTGLGNISKTGVSWFGARLSADFDNSAPTWQSNVDAILSLRTADATGTTQDPKLVVVHVLYSSGSIFNSDVIFGSDVIFR